MLPWSEPELELLKSWIGVKPLQQVLQDWNSIARERGWPERSNNGIHIKFSRSARLPGGSRSVKTTQDNLSMCDLAKSLDIPNDRIRKWVRLGLTRQEYGHAADNRPHKTAIARSNLREFAASHPEEFWGIDPKKLSKALGDPKLARKIHKTVDQPTVGRPITVIRLDDGEVYKSAKHASATVSIPKHVILHVCKRETPARGGSDWCQLDYPVFWVPLSVREEFNFLAGKLLYEIYIQFQKLDGFTKLCCVVVAARIAVQITLATFRKRDRQVINGEKLTPKEIIADFYQKRILEQMTMFLGLDQRQGWQRIVGKIKYMAYSTFRSMLPKDTSAQIQAYLEEFAMQWIQDYSKYFLKNSYLPTGYKVNNKLEIADFYTSAYASPYATIDLGEKGKLLLLRVKAYRYILKHYALPLTADLSGTGMEDDSLDRGLSYRAQVAASTNDAPQQEDAAALLDELLGYVEKTVSKQECDRIKLYVSLKLEECSDKEIAKVMGLREPEVTKIAQRRCELTGGDRYVHRSAQSKLESHQVPRLLICALAKGLTWFLAAVGLNQ